MKKYLLIAFLIFSLTLSAQQNYLSKDINTVKELAKAYDPDILRYDNGVKAVKYRDAEVGLTFCIMYQPDEIYASHVFVFPDDKLMERTLFMFLDKNWTIVDDRNWYSWYNGKKILAKAEIGKGGSGLYHISYTYGE